MDTKIKAVFTVVPQERLSRPLYRRVGTAFVNQDMSLFVVLDALPLNGQLVIRDAALRPDVDELPYEADTATVPARVHKASNGTSSRS